MSVLFRLEGGQKKIEFKTDDGRTISVFAHYPEPEEITAANLIAGIELTDEMLDDQQQLKLDGKARMEYIIRQASACVELACMCVESIEGVELEVDRSLGEYGLERISSTAQRALGRKVLKEIGLDLLTDSRLSEDENFPSSSQPTGSTTES